MLRALDPFLVFDSYESRPNGGGSVSWHRGFPAHPHAGFDELRYITAGRLRHTDSCGNDAHTEAGGLQVLRTGTGIAHEERPDRRHLVFSGFQVWLNAPQRRKRVEVPVHWVIPAADFANLSIADTILGPRTGLSCHTRAGDRDDATPTSPPPRGWVKVISTAVRGSLSPLSDFFRDPPLTWLHVVIGCAGGHVLTYRTTEVGMTSPNQPRAHVVLYVMHGELLVGDPLQGDDAADAVGRGEFAAAGDGDVVHMWPSCPAQSTSVEFLLLSAPRLMEPAVVGHGFVGTTPAEVAHLNEAFVRGEFLQQCGGGGNAPRQEL